MTDKEMDALTSEIYARAQVIGKARARRREHEDSLIAKARAGYQKLADDVRKYYVPVFAQVIDCCAVTDKDFTVGYVSSDPDSPEYRSVLCGIDESLPPPCDYELRVVFSEDCDSGYLAVDCYLVNRRSCIRSFGKRLFSCAGDMKNDVKLNELNYGNAEVAYFACLDTEELRTVFAQWAREAMDGEIEVACRDMERAEKDVLTLGIKGESNA